MSTSESICLNSNYSIPCAALASLLTWNKVPLKIKLLCCIYQNTERICVELSVCVFIVCHLLESCRHLLLVHFQIIVTLSPLLWRRGHFGEKVCVCDISSLLGRGRFSQMNKCFFFFFFFFLFFKQTITKQNPQNAFLLVLPCQPPNPTPHTHALFFCFCIQISRMKVL